MLYVMISSLILIVFIYALYCSIINYIDKRIGGLIDVLIKNRKIDI